MRRRPQLVGLLWRWHRRLGVLAALFVLVLAVTGIVLNHTPGLGLDRRFVDWAWLSRAYGDSSADLPAYRLGTQWLSRAADGRVFLDALEVAPCRGKLLGAVLAGQFLLAGCAQELLLITGRGELVESVTGSTGLRVPLTGLGLADGKVVMQTEEGWWLADLDAMDFSRPVPGGTLVSELSAGQLPESIRREIPAPAQWLSWERLLLDIHSGRVFGRLGVLWVDFIGVLLTVIATSGVAMWALHWRRRRRHARASHSAR